MIYPEINAYLEWLKANNREHGIDAYLDWEESRGVTYNGSGVQMLIKLPMLSDKRTWRFIYGKDKIDESGEAD